MKNRITTHFILIAVSCALAGGAWATPVDPDPDGVGFYFDQDATINCHFAPAPSILEIWICLTNASDPLGAYGWECRVEFPEHVIFLGSVLNGVGINIGIFPDFIVGLAEPLPWADSIWLARLDLLLLLPDPAYLYLQPVSVPSIPGEVVYASGSDYNILIPMHPSTGGFDTPVATINGDCVIPVEPVTWGGVKAMYSDATR